MSLRSLIGLFLVVFAVLALTGPGRIDIVDGQARYEVARSLALNGDSAIRNPHVWFGVFPGPEGLRYTYYRFPHSVLGVPAVWLADVTGEPTEGRRHFFFVLVSAAAAGALAVVYAVAFLAQGLSAGAAYFWATGGIFCTPCWYYGTSTFDEIFGAVALVGTIYAATQARTRDSTGWTVAAALALGLAFNCKQPLGAFGLLAIALADDSTRRPAARWRRAGVLAAGLGLGIAGHYAYFWLKFPPATTPDHATELARYAPAFFGEPLSALLAMAVSPGAGVFWYAPVVLLTLAGLPKHWRQNPWAGWAGAVSAAVFVGFVACLTFFKGDIAWGPRYLTPLVALGWLLAPAGAARLPRWRVVAILGAGAVVQILALAVDPYRLFIEKNARSAVLPAQAYFTLPLAQLYQRPRELVEVARSQGAAAQAYSPAWEPTAAPPTIDKLPPGETVLREFAIFDSPRPWWCSLSFLPPDRRPVDIERTALILGAVLIGGALLSAWGIGVPWRKAGCQGGKRSSADS